MPRIRTERVCGPYYDETRRQPWAVHFIRADGGRRVVRVATEAAAEKLIGEGRQEAQGRTVSAAVESYLEHKRDSVSPGTLTTLGYRLHGILRTGERDRLLRDLRAPVAAALYAKRSGETRADTHRSELASAESWAAWCIKRGWIKSNPFAGVEPVGKRAAGKTQHTIDEARRFVAIALGEGTAAGVAAACAEYLGLAASEVTDRKVRDLDDGGALLWITRGKTKNRRRHMIVPDELRAPLLALAQGRASDEPLFGYREMRKGEARPVDRYWLGYHVRRLCDVAGVTVVTPHSLRGLHGTLAVSAGTEVSQVARQLGHGGPGVTRRHYLAPGAEAAAGHERAMRVLQGGKS